MNEEERETRIRRYAREMNVSERTQKRLRANVTLLEQVNACKDDAARRLLMGVSRQAAGEDECRNYFDKSETKR